MGFYTDHGDDPRLLPLSESFTAMPTLEQLARHDSPPSDEIRAAILVAAAGHDSNPYWTHAEVHQTYRDVTIGQVALVLLNNPRN